MSCFQLKNHIINHITFIRQVYNSPILYTQNKELATTISKWKKNQLNDTSLESKWIDHILKLNPHFYHNGCLYITGMKKFKFNKSNVDFLDFDIQSACIRQGKFLNKSIPFLSTREDHLKLYEDHYYKFLQLCKKYPDNCLVPTVPIDLVWHSHLNDHEKYINDTILMFSKILNHNDDIKQDTKDSLLETTKTLWLKYYNESYPTYSDILQQFHKSTRKYNNEPNNSSTSSCASFLCDYSPKTVDANHTSYTHYTISSCSSFSSCNSSSSSDCGD